MKEISLSKQLKKSETQVCAQWIGSSDRSRASGDRNQNQETDFKATQVLRTVSADLSAHFLRLVDLGKGAFQLLGRYEASLWRQMRQTLFTLDVQISDVNTQPFYRQQLTGA